MPVDSDRLNPGEVLLPGQGLSSPNGMLRVVFQTDGNFCIGLMPYGRRCIWASDTVLAGTDRPTKAAMQTDGHLVLYKNDPIQWYWVSNDVVGYGPILLVENRAVRVINGDQEYWRAPIPLPWLVSYAVQMDPRREAQPQWRSEVFYATSAGAARQQAVDRAGIFFAGVGPIRESEDWAGAPRHEP